MSTVPLGEEQLDRRVVLVVDLSGQPLPVLSALEELLADLAAWEESDATDPPQARAPLRLPAPLAGGVALAAGRRAAGGRGPAPGPGRRCGGGRRRWARPSAWAGSGAGCWPPTAATRILRCRC